MASVFLARFAAVVRAFVPMVAGILKMSPRHFYAANILSALAWAPAHVFPGVLLGAAVTLAGASPEQLSILLIAGIIVVSTIVWTIRFCFNQNVFRRPDSAILPLNMRVPEDVHPAGMMSPTSPR